MTNQELIHELWATHETLRRLGFSADKIFVVPNIIDPDTEVSGVGVLLADGDMKFAIAVAPCEGTYVDFAKQWSAWATRLPELPVAELLEIYAHSTIRKNLNGLCCALIERGYMLTAPMIEA